MDSNSTDRTNRALTGTTSRRQALKMLGGGLVGGAMAGAGVTAVSNAAAQPDRGPNPMAVPVYTENSSGSFSGTATIAKLVEGGDTGLLANVLVTGTLTEFGEESSTPTETAYDELVEGVSLTLWSEGGSATSLEGARAFAQQGGSCQILFLELGPIYLDVLGLVIEIPDPIVIDVRAERGPGNLLCAVAGLLDGGGGGLQGLLRQINRILTQLLG